MSIGNALARFHVVAGIQARLSSTRLPRKVLANIGGRPLVLRVVERVRLARRVDEVFVLTSDDPSDDPLADVLEREGVPVRRGPLADVLARFVALADERRPDALVRVTADCPLVDPAHIDRQVAALRRFDADLVRAAGGTRFLEGVLGGAGVLSARALRCAADSRDPRDREHVGSFLFRSEAARFRWAEVEVPERHRRPDVRLSVDEPADLALQRRLWEGIGPESGVPLDDALAWLDAHPAVRDANRRVVESADNRALRGHDEASLPPAVGGLPLAPPEEAAA